MLPQNRDLAFVLFRRTILLLLLWLQVFPVLTEQEEDIPHNGVNYWAIKFGADLWQYGKLMTKMNELQSKYHKADIDVVRKDGLILIREMATEVKNMMDFKMSAVKRIMDSAEQAAQTPQTDNRQRLLYYNAKRLNAFGPDGRPADGTREMILTPNPHFDNLPVNTSLSSILMPNNVNEYDPEVLSAIQWSEHLDPLFINNYEGDPSLSWQFFGSSTGFLRRYPGIAWPPEDMSAVWNRQKEERGMHDFRSSSWYINAVTSPKDIVILIDNSGSMTGHRSNLARATAEAILDTITDNDFVNVFKFSATTEETEPCFKDQLAQANGDNVRYLKESLATLKPDNIANFTAALITGFEILQKYNRSGQGCQCNQAIMLITDGPPSRYNEIFKTYNFPHSPVRFFTYLIGKDSNSVGEMHWMACSHKGFYTRIDEYDTIREKVLNYINVMARPMVMYQNDHPIHWTPPFVGGKSDNLAFDKQAKLITTVTTPVFNRRNHTIRVANILGVVGTDVSIDQIKKLVPPYKIGVNGYSFIVDNNGHALYHPDLRPLKGSDNYDDNLEPNYISVDLAELELVDSENGPRENNTVLLDLRHDMIDQKEGEIELSIKVHYDDMRRATTRRNKYFYNAIDGTPFSLGLAIPEGYGMYELLAEQEIKHSQKNVTEFFKGANWKVHPDWVYCEYTSGTSGDHYFKTPEERVLHFLSRSRRPGWKWMSLRPRSPLQREHHHVSTKQDKEAYYCDKTLLQSLVLDAMVTDDWEKHTIHNDKHQGYEIFGLVLTFVATRSGLLRWTNWTNMKSHEPNFSESNIRAIEETWYKRAVDQHMIEPESFVFSVPFDVGSYGKPLITATHAVFVEHKGHRAPAAVVGLQYQHATLAAHFHNITSKCTDASCKVTCASEKLDCYVLDNNGFVIISENNDHTGRFFGQIDGTIMDSLVQDKIYIRIPMYDYQGSCPKSNYNFNSSVRSPGILDPVKWLLSLVLKNFVTILSKLNFIYGNADSYSQVDEELLDVYSEYDLEYPSGENFNEEKDRVQPPFVPPYESDPMEGIPIDQYGGRRCDRKVNLYTLQPDKLNNNPLKGKLTNCHNSGCERPFSVQRIPHSNLILLVVDTTCPCGSKQLSIIPEEINYELKNGGCFNKPKDSFYRKRPPKCINYHPEETEIRICGGSPKIVLSHVLLTLAIIYNLYHSAFLT